MQELVQDLIEQHNLGKKLAQAKLGSVPQYLVLEKLEDAYLLGRTGIHFIQVKFNSENGPFQDNIGIKEFRNPAEAQRFLQLNNWLINQIGVSHHVKVPLLAIYDVFAIYDGIDGHGFEFSPIEEHTKFKLSGEALGSFHANTAGKINEYRYMTFLKTKINDILLSDERKAKLLSFGLAFWTYYNKNKSGVYSFGDFHAGNIIISSNGAFTYLVYPQHIESTIEKDRMDDISNFFIHFIIEEYLKTKNIDNSLKNLQIFIEAYNSNLRLKSGTSLEVLYDNTFWIAIFFHLGMVALEKGPEIIKRLTVDNEPENMVEVLQTYKITRYLWRIGMQYLPATVFPHTITPNHESEEGFLITWAYLGNTVIDMLRNDEYLQFLFDFPESSTSVTIDEGLSHWTLSDKKELKLKLEILNSWFPNPLVYLSKEILEINSNWQSHLGLPTHYDQNWELSTKLLVNVLLKNPDFALIQYIETIGEIEEKKLNELDIVDKKFLKSTLKKLKKLNVINNKKHIITLNNNWKQILQIPLEFDFKYFG